MDPMDILRRSWRITRSHRALWVFGLLLALTSGGAGLRGYSLGGGDRRTEGIVWSSAGTFYTTEGVLTILLAAACLIFMLIVISVIVRYVAATSLYRSVDDLETEGIPPTVRRGFSLGWSRRAFRQFLIDLLVGIPLVVAIILMFLLALSPMLLLASDNTALQVGGVFISVGLILLVVLVILAVAMVMSLLTQFWHREVAIGGKGVVEAIRGGTRLVRANLRDAIVVYLVLIGIGIGWGMLMFPVVIVVGLLALAMGGGPGYLVSQITGSVPAGWLVGVPIGLAVFIIPLAVLSALYITFSTTAWTLVYLELAGQREAAMPDESPPSEEG